MKKKIMIFFILCMSTLTLTGCGEDATMTRNLRHEGFSVGSNFVCDALIPNEKGDAYDKIRYFGGSYAVTETGRLYDINLTTLYSNKQNCKSADTNIVIEAIFDGTVARASDGKYYYLVSGNNIEAYTEITINDKSYDLYNLLLSDENVLKVKTINSNSGEYYILKKDGEISSYIVARENYNSPFQIVDVEVKYDANKFGGPIIDFDYAGESAGTFFRTRQRIYRMDAANKEECTNYADIACQYQLVRSEGLEEYLDDIIAYNGSTLIMSNGKIFNG